MAECLGCNAIETNPVTLLDSRVVCSSCDLWRVECLEREKEARAILAMPKDDRRGAIGEYERRHCAEARRRLEDAIKLLWKFRS